LPAIHKRNKLQSYEKLKYTKVVFQNVFKIKIKGHIQKKSP